MLAHMCKDRQCLQNMTTSKVAGVSTILRVLSSLPFCPPDDRAKVNINRLNTNLLIK